MEAGIVAGGTVVEDLPAVCQAQESWPWKETNRDRGQPRCAYEETEAQISTVFDLELSFSILRLLKDSIPNMSRRGCKPLVCAKEGCVCVQVCEYVCVYVCLGVYVPGCV